MIRDHQPEVTLAVEVTEGRVAAAILNNGFLEHCVRLGAAVNLLTPGVAYPPFVERYRTDGVTFTSLSWDTPVHGKGRLVRWEQALGRRLTHNGMWSARRRLWHHVGARLAAADAGPVASLLGAAPPDCFVATDVYMGFGRGLVGSCQRRGIPTLGNIFSWDHPFYEHPSRPDRVTCWSPMVKNELVRRSGYLADRIEVIGAPAYDAYVDPANMWTRNQLCDRMGLDVRRPIVLFATLGQMKKFWDETGSFRALLEEIDAGRIPGRPQVVLRLHPVSNSQYFEEISARPDVVISRYVGYSPGMRWWPSQDEVILAANLLRHADVCLSPGSTMAIEPAIFDTPTIVPVFNQYMPEEYQRFFDKHWMAKHFEFLTQHALLPLVRSAGEMADAICRALADRSWMTAERKTIRDDVFGPLDGHATRRLAEAAIRAARSANPGRRRRTGADHERGGRERVAFRFQ